MSEFKNITEVKEYFKKDKFAQFLGFVIEEAEPGKSKISVEVQENHLNGVDIAHGGFTFSLCDFAGAVATNFYGLVSLSIDSNITYYNQPKSNMLTAIAKEVNRSRRLSHITVQVYDSLGTHIVGFKGTYYITEREINKLINDKIFKKC